MMAKITERSEWRVVVHPKRRGDFGSVIFSDNHYTQEERERHFDNLTKDIRAAIKRHVDGVDRIDILYDTHDYCSHCGREWETEESGIPVCCSKAQDEWATERHRGL